MRNFVPRLDIFTDLATSIVLQVASFAQVSFRGISSDFFLCVGYFWNVLLECSLGTYFWNVVQEHIAVTYFCMEFTSGTYFWNALSNVLLENTSGTPHGFLLLDPELGTTPVRSSQSLVSFRCHSFTPLFQIAYPPYRLPLCLLD